MHNDENANEALEERLITILESIYTGYEIEDDDFKVLCYCCGVPFETVQKYNMRNMTKVMIP